MYKRQADTYLVEVKDEVTQEAAELGENFHPFQLVISYEDAFYGKGVLSYLTTVWEYRGGANGTTKGVGKIYDLQTGETKTLGDYINLQSGLTERDYMVQVFRRDMAVSYTHLDVYKRQLWKKPFIIIRTENAVLAVDKKR